MAKANLVKLSILLSDIVGYSELDGPVQVEAIERLNSVVRDAVAQLDSKLQKQIGYLPTGDGMFVLAPVGVAIIQVAEHIHRRYGADRSMLKIGINEGYVFRINDITGRDNVTSGINLAGQLSHAVARAIYWSPRVSPKSCFKLIAV